MMQSGGQQPGYTSVITSIAMNAPLTLRAVDNGGPIRSLTIGNQTTSTTVSVYLGQSVSGAVLYAIQPGNFVTIPVMGSASVTLAFAYASGGKFDGTIFVHTDPQPLAASGFTQSQANISAAVSASLFVTSEANGTVPAYCPPVYTAGGLATAGATEHIVRGSLVVPVGSGVTYAGAAFVLSGPAIFSSATSYQIVGVCNLSQSCPAGWQTYFLGATFNQVNGSTVQLFVGCAGLTTTGSGNVGVNFVAVGY